MALAAGLVAGCIPGEPVRPTTWLDQFHSFRGPAGPDVVQMDVALLERPVGDLSLNRDLWTFTDEQGVALDRQALLEDNGFRVGQVGGNPPARLLELLTSERSCVNSQRIRLHAGAPRALALGPARAACQFDLHLDGRPTPVSWRQAQCLLQITPTLTADGRTRLRFLPQLRHGSPVLLPRPAADHSGLVWPDQPPTEEYPALAWDVCLAPNEYVLVGTRYDRPGTLGHQAFFRGDEPTPVQRVLVIRTGRPVVPVTDSDGDADAAFDRSPPLALQAAATKARGSSP